MRAEQLIEGLKIITRTQPDADVAAQYDQIYVGAHKPRKLTKEEREQMEHLGWFESEESWSHFT